MTSGMRTYYMALVGGIAGLASWSIVSLALYLFPSVGEQTFLLDPLNMTVLGAVLTGLAVAFSDHLTEDEFMPTWILAGLGVGLLMGLVSGFLATPIQSYLGAHVPIAGRVLPWLLAGELIGFGAGLRWMGTSRHRPLIAMFGGLVGASLGGFIFNLSATPFMQASAFVLTGVGITCGVTLAPVLLSEGAICFVSSGDPRAQNKLRGMEWPLQHGDKLLFGSHQPRTMFRKEVVMLHDSMVAPRHAFFVSEKGTFFVENHPDNTGPQGLPVQPLLVNDGEVVGVRKLSLGDIITIGSTQLSFQSKGQRKNSGSREAI